MKYLLIEVDNFKWVGRSSHQNKSLEENYADIWNTVIVSNIVDTKIDRPSCMLVNRFIKSYNNTFPILRNINVLIDCGVTAVYRTNDGLYNLIVDMDNENCKNLRPILRDKVISEIC